ncbi:MULTISPECIES: hypothetical protein [Sporosarcina]|uniref:hypothetical protein n=1 Tax=Sporosarcina TaxID=1569 RepID=UPI00193ABFCB|nr:hypothetical protein [Sporosarcina beigongshangi]
MLKRILIINGILIVGIASFSMLNKHSEVDTPVANKDEPEPLSTKEQELQFSALNTVTEKNMRNIGIWSLQ